MAAVNGAAAALRQAPPPPPPAAAQRLPAAAAATAAQAWQRPRLSRRQTAAFAASSSSSNGSTRTEEMEQPTPEEMEQAQAALKDFLHGMGAGGRTQRPADLPEARMSRAEAASLVGMAGWRLHGKVCPAIETLAAQVEALWTSVLPEDQFGLLDLDQRFKYLDTLDPAGKQEMVFAVPDPPRDSKHYPRLQVENRAYWSRAFRKLHIEVAVRQDGLQVFHCVMYPRLTYDLPILSMDVVANNDMVSLAIIDPCPVTPSLQLPPFYEAPVRELQQRYQLENNRDIPPWGRAIFSPCCVIMRPQGGEDLGRFLKYALALTQMHVQIAKIAHPVTSGPGAQRRIEAIHVAHQRYCDKQLENDKTRRVLAAAFGEQLAEEYMRTVMFSVEPLPAQN